MRTHTRLAVFLLCLALPLSAWGMGSVRVDDSIAGLGLETQAMGFMAHEKIDLVVIPPSGAYAVFPLTTDPKGSVRFHVPGTVAEAAGTYRIFAGQNGMRVTGETSCVVLPDAVDAKESSMSAASAVVRADGTDTVAVTVTLRDRYGNVLAGRPVELVAGKAQAHAESERKETDAQGVIRFSVTADAPGTYTFRALDLLSNTLLLSLATVTATADAAGGVARTNTYDGGGAYRAQLTGEPSVTAPGIVSTFEITVDPKALETNEMASLTIRAVDRDGRTVEDYTGTVDIYSPTDPSAVIPGFSETLDRGRVTFAPRNLGVKYLPLSVSFRKAGTQVLRIEDVTNPDLPVSGEARVTVTGNDVTVPGGLTVTAPGPDAMVRGQSVLVEGTARPYVEILITGGTAKVSGDTDGAGRFSIDVPLPPKYGEYTLLITDGAGGEETLHLVRDIDPPEIVSMSFSPEKPQEGARTLFVIQSEPGLPDVKMRLGEQDLALKEDVSKPGIYQLLFTAPTAGEYQPALLARDDAGNETRMLAPLGVTPKVLPKVQRLKAVAKNGAVDLSWDPVRSEPVEKYRVYVGEKPEEFSYTLETENGDQTAVIVSGVNAGIPYYFAVTAVKGDRESEKSETVTVRPLGIQLRVTPEIGALGLEWSLPADISLKGFLVEYGVEEGTYPEKRMIPGGDLRADEKRSLLLRDLLPGITYVVRITPLAATGDPLGEIVARGEGTPLSADGTHFAPADPPSLVDDVPDLPQPTPDRVETGLPPWTIGAVAVAALALFSFFWRRRNAARATQDFLRVMETRYRA
ncbi:MAG: Ig-like domain-containing protein [Candidatus Peribacteraceae bacterium]|nr:Ig-like domain-containing protein [Candidatus Peribacteraceae bacterium]